MNVEQLETFLDIVESRNFQRSADRLGLAQSSISARIRSLESSLNTQLFVRGRQGATPTIAGEKFEEHARLLLATWYQACRDVGTESTTLRLAGQISLMRPILIDWISELQKQNASGAIDIHEPFLMVSSYATTLNQVSVERYINTGYTDYFDRCHSELLPHLSFGHLNIGNEELAVELLKRNGGSLYLPARLANTVCQKESNMFLVEDAPVIDQPIYSSVHIRRQYDENIVTALAILKNVATDSMVND